LRLRNNRAEIESSFNSKEKGIMSGKKVGVFGIYSTRMAVENATDSLVKSGFPTSDISVLLPESRGGPKDMGTEKSTKAPEGAAAGVTAGGVIGGTLGVLAGTGEASVPNKTDSGVATKAVGESR
jgi:hypothetical protein